MHPGLRARRLAAGAALGLSVACFASTPARAGDGPAEPEPAWQTQKPVRRAGFTLGLAIGPALGTTAGFPNDAKKIERAKYYTETGVGYGAQTMVWIGGALTDWFSFGIGGGGGSLAFGDKKLTGGSFGFRIETFPAWALGGTWRELGVVAETGTGAATLTSKSDGKLVFIDSGSASRVGIGAFYEGIRLWRVSMGPLATFDYMWSASMRQPTFFFGWRTALYTARVEPPPARRASR